MSGLLGARPKRPAPRLVTKALPTTAQSSAAAERYAHDTSKPHPGATADAMGATVLAYLITGPVVYGGLGWLIDRWLGITVFVVIGILGGMAMSLHSVWLRYGTSQAPPDRNGTSIHGAAPQNEENQ